MSTTRRTTGSPSSSTATNQQPDVEPMPSDENFINQYIPHFKSLYKRKNKGNQQQRRDQATTVEDPSLNFIEVDGRISERLLQHDESSVKDKAYQEIQEAREYNTSVSYCAKQLEFLRFCHIHYAGKGQMVRYLATGDSLLAFLWYNVINRTLRKPGTKYVASQLENTELEAETIIAESCRKKLSYSTCNVYVSVIVDLWQYQKFSGSNNLESPRSHVVTRILKMVRKREAVENHRNNVDRVRNSTVNGYSTFEDVQKIAKSCYNNAENNFKFSFRNALAVLLCHYLLLRGESIRQLEFADLQFDNLSKVRAEGSYPVIKTIFNQGKTNKFNKTVTGACMRNKMVEICPFMAMSFHFFWRWHCQKESFPDMMKNENWFKLKVINGARPQSNKKYNKKGKRSVGVTDANDDDVSSEDESYDTGVNPLECCISKTSHTRFMKKAFEDAGVFVTRKVTHVPRGSGAKMADLLGVPSLQIEKMGGWNLDTMSNSYLDSLPRDFMRVMAGFNTDADYFLPRAEEEPCNELKQLVFPWADYWLDKYASNDVLQASGSGDTFLRLIKCFKTTFLQDAAVMMDVIPGHPIWKHEIFRDPLFLDLQSKVKEHVQSSSSESRSSLIRRLVPEIQRELFNMNRTIGTTVQALEERQTNMENAQSELLQIAHRFTTGQFHITVTMKDDNQGTATAVAASSTSITVPPRPTPAQVSTSNTPEQPSVATNDVPENSRSLVVTTPTRLIRQVDEAGIPIYRMSRQVETVNDLWDEWKTGIDGDWAVEEIESKWGTKWRKNDRKWFNIRKNIINAIEDLGADLGLSQTVAIQHLQGVKNIRNWSLDRLGTSLQSGEYYPSEQTKKRKLNTPIANKTTTKSRSRN